MEPSDPTQTPFHIYRSGAGSGKTFTLAKSFLEIALRPGSSFKNILGVTFTNKATEEMKNRIISILRALASGQNHPMQKDLCESLSINVEELQKRSASVLSDILHQYGRFSIVTIDSFFNGVIRSFAREMGLQGTFTIDLDQSAVLERVIDKMMQEIGEEDKKQLKSWLTEFAEIRVEEGKPWDFRKDVISLSGEILKDGFKQHAAEVMQLNAKRGFFKSFRAELIKIRIQFEQTLQKYNEDFEAYLQQNAIDIKDFSRGKFGPAGLFDKLGRLELEVSDTKRAASEDLGIWLTKANLKNQHLVSHVEQNILPKYNDLIAYFDQNLIHYQSSVEVLRYLFTFGILSQINSYIQQYRDDNDVILIADLPDFLHQIISDSETPFIYEKVGSVFRHYLIDEFQDTSAFQWDNFKPLVKNTTDEGNFSMVVGDVKQSIYRFRGGEWELLQQRVKHDIGEYHAATHHLDTNWRSDSNIIDFNNGFFNKAKVFSESRFNDLITAVPDDGIRNKISERVNEVFSTFDDVAQSVPSFKSEDSGYVRIEFIDEKELDEEKWQDQAIWQTIKSIEDLQIKGFELRDIAILVRYGREGKKIADAIVQYRNSSEANPDLKYEVVSNEALYLTSSHLVRFIVSIIKWLNDQANTIALCEWLYEYQKYILNSEVPDEVFFSRHDDWQNIAPREFVKKRDFLKTLPLFELVEHIILMFDLNEIKDEYTYLQGFQDAVLEYSKNERGDIVSFLTWWEDVKSSRSVKISEENNAIKILTVHKSKGLEFPVVILPFLSWGFDHEGSNDNILWCEGSKAPAPYNTLPVVPMRYSSNLASTYWAEQYYHEKLRAYLDNLNLLYVALTRPVNALIGFGKFPSAKSSTFAAYTLLHQVLSNEPEYNVESSYYEKGTLNVTKASQSSSLEYGLLKYHSAMWRGKVSVQVRASAELNEQLFDEAIARGLRMHEILSKVKYVTDMKSFVGQQYHDDMIELLKNEQIKGWFSHEWKVATEVPILLPGGDFRRIDRVNMSDKETLIIDFKTGEKRKKDQAQVKEYMSLLEDMDYPDVKGYLIYLNDMMVEEVTNG